MKTIRLSKLESAAYTNGERRFWRAMRKQPREGHWIERVSINHWWPFLNTPEGKMTWLADGPIKCWYGLEGDHIALVLRPGTGAGYVPITAIAVEQRGGRWGWVVEVGA
jgi:hypothetical protein